MAIAIMIGDCLQSLRELPGNSIQTCITSPPYFGLRDYGADGQIGLEETPEEYIAKLVAVFAEVRRVLRDDGTLWVNIGDSYCMNGHAKGQSSVGTGKNSYKDADSAAARARSFPGYKRKDLLMIPARLAMALQSDGWWLRSEIIWHKPNAMPDSAKDRPGIDHEKIYLLSKSQRYFYDAEAVKVPSAGTGGGNFSAKTQAGRRSVIGGGQVKERQPDTGFRNLRTVWSVPTQAFKGAHFAPFPTALVEPCIKAASRPGDAVLDPFGGSGTTGLVAGALGRHTVLCELNPAYAELARQRLVDGLGIYAQVEMLPEPDIRIAA